MKTASIMPLAAGLILAEDLYTNQTLIVKKGTVIDHDLIKKLKRWDITEVPVLQPLGNLKPKLASTIQTIPPAHTYSEQRSRELYFQTILKIADEKRYGIAFNMEDSFYLLTSYFTNLMQTDVIMAKMLQLKSHDSFSFNHSVDVFILFTLLAKRLNLSDLEVHSHASLVHDIGKAELPAVILSKKGKLTKLEFEIVKAHTTLGYKFLTGIPSAGNIADLALAHHERMDGSGYPYGLQAQELSMAVRILMVVDVYSALTLERMYRSPLPAEEALGCLAREPHLYDPYILQEFMQMLHIYPLGSPVVLSDGREAIVRGHTANFPSLMRLSTRVSGEEVEIPSDFSLKISCTAEDILAEESDWKKELWAVFISSLAEGRKRTAFEAFEKLADGMRVEDIYRDILYAAAMELSSQFKMETISRTSLHIADDCLCYILDRKREFYISLIPARHKMLIVFHEQEQYYFPSLLFQDYFSANGWETYKHFGASAALITELAESRKIHYICFTVTSTHSLGSIRLLTEEIKKLNPKLLILIFKEFFTQDEIEKGKADFIAKSPESAVIKLSIMERLEAGKHLFLNELLPEKGE
ncbi:HD domain-containing phosphohydrolase [Metabacillus mangrovi]|nr:HD domain-containing phosphohydrolase [Metabacillus mangrovi]